MDSTSESLLRRLRGANNEAAWPRFVELYAPLIFYWARNHGLDSADAADFVQDVLAILVVKLPQFEYDPTKRFRGWLRTVTLNRLRDLARQKAVAPKITSADWLDERPSVETGDLFDEQEYRSFVATRALNLIQSEFRAEVWQACWKQIVDGQKATDVARELNMTVNSVYLAKSRVISRLREEFEDLLE